MERNVCRSAGPPLKSKSEVQQFPRLVMQEVGGAGVPLAAGAGVVVLLGSANHVEQKFPDPERFDMMYDTEGHVGVGFGIYFCLGA